MSTTEGTEEDDAIDVLQDLLDTVRKYEALEEESELLSDVPAEEDTLQYPNIADEDYGTKKTVSPCSHKTTPDLTADLQLDTCLRNFTVPEWTYHGVTKSQLDKFGSVKFTSGVIYQGSFNSNKLPHGIGRIIFTDGSIFDGEIVDGKIGNRGMYTWPDGSRYEGSLRDGFRNGYGRHLDGKTADFYAGDWLCSQKEGYGKMVYGDDSCDVYRGQWHQDVPWGSGSRRWPSGNVYKGDWAQGLPHGNGEYIWREEMVHYRGEFQLGRPHGYGVLIWILRHQPSALPTSQRYYYGHFEHGRITGFGVFHDINQTVYKGHWTDGRKNGEFTVTLANGIVLECQFADDKIRDTLPRFLFKEVNGKQFAWPLPGPTVHQLEFSPFAPNNELCALVLPGTLRYLSEGFGFSIDLITSEMKGLGTIIAKYYTQIDQVYSVYSRLMVEWSCQNTYVLKALQYWQFVYDVGVEKDSADCPLQQGLFYLIEEIEKFFDQSKRFSVFCHPYQPMMQTEFLDRMVVLAYVIEREKQLLRHLRSMSSSKMLSSDNAEHGKAKKTSQLDISFRKTWLVPGEPVKSFIERRLLKKAGLFKGSLFDDPEKSSVLFRYVSKLFQLYKYIYELYGGQEKTMPDAYTLDLLLFALKHSHISELPGLSYADILRVFESEYPEMRDRTGSLVLQVPVTFLEFVQLMTSLALSYSGPLEIKEETVKLLTGRGYGVQGRIVEAVDSVLLTTEKRPNLLKDDGIIRPDFDVEFFQMLRQKGDVPHSSPTTENSSAEIAVDLSEFNPTADWERQVSGFLDEVLFPKMIVLKHTNDYLIIQGYARPLGTRDEGRIIADHTINTLLKQNKQDSGDHNHEIQMDKIMENFVNQHFILQYTESS